MVAELLLGLAVGLLVGAIFGWFMRRPSATAMNKELDSHYDKLETELEKLKALTDADGAPDADAFNRLQAVLRNADSRLKMLEQSLEVDLDSKKDQ